jgi:hypothetical protein
MVIDAMVRARLLGLQLLTLEARVVVGTQAGSPAVLHSSARYPASRLSPRTTGREVVPPDNGPASELARAVELVEQGEHTLERSRRRAIPAARTAAL